MAFYQTENVFVNQLADGVAELVLDIPGGTGNGLTGSALADIEHALDRIGAHEPFTLLLLRTGKKRSFCVGLSSQILADTSPDALGTLAAAGQKLCDKLAKLRVPSVAIIAGTCLGGGLELALACDYRVAVDKPSTVLGLPQAEFGLLPMWGGTQRLPQLVGLEHSLQLLLGGRKLRPRDALAWGLVDAIADDANPLPPGFLNDPQKRSLPFLPLRALRQKLSESTRLGRYLVFRGAERILHTRLPDDMPAPARALNAVRIGLQQGNEAGLAEERKAAAELAQTEAARNLTRLHCQRERMRTEATARAQRFRPKVISVVGAGDKGSALIAMAVTRGYKVIIKEANEAALGLALFRMLAVLQMEVARGAMAKNDLMKNLGNIRGTTAWKGFDEVDLVLDASDLDASDDDPDKKRTLFQDLDKNTHADAVLVSTDSTAPLADLQDGLSHPKRVGVLHFLAPLGQALLVEVASTPRCDLAGRLSDFVVSLGRVPRLVGGKPGLLVDRFLLPYFNEAILLVKEGIAPARVDEAMVRFGMNHGPLELLDQFGLDAAASLADALADDLAPRLLLDETFAMMVQENWLGEKTGLGFYRYRKKKKKAHPALIQRLRATSHIDAPHQVEAVSHQDQLAIVQGRLVPLMINEAAWCLEEGRAESADDLDLTLCFAGWAPHRGGPLHYARHLGMDLVLQELEELASVHGGRYEPCPGLRRLAKPV
jgi:3-hydroxyacyl-CoA dehydrogenase/enoyl-CoA hydratase/3-hydroxybutyryl-CoA epimerase